MNFNILLLTGIGSVFGCFEGLSFEEFANAIHQVETSGRTGPILSDKGKSLGPLCITKLCWEDVKKQVGGVYSDCADLNYSKTVLYFYCKKYEKDAFLLGNWENCAKLWNAGPSWRKKSPEVQKKLDKYWLKVKSKL